MSREKERTAEIRIAKDMVSIKFPPGMRETLADLYKSCLKENLEPFRTRFPLAEADAQIDANKKLIEQLPKEEILADWLTRINDALATIVTEHRAKNSQ